jgi:hypothetical protein
MTEILERTPQMTDTWKEHVNGHDITYTVEQQDGSNYLVKATVGNTDYSVVVHDKPTTEQAMRAISQNDPAFRRAIGMQ